MSRAEIAHRTETARATEKAQVVQVAHHPTKSRPRGTSYVGQRVTEKEATYPVFHVQLKESKRSTDSYVYDPIFRNEFLLRRTLHEWLGYQGGGRRLSRLQRACL